MTATRRRLRALDAMRGIAILAMIPFHIVIYGGALLWSGGGLSEQDLLHLTEQLVVVELRPPLTTGLSIFFFVTGMSLAISTAQRRDEQSPLALWRHVILRYGGYVLVGIVSEFIMWTLLSVQANAQINFGELVNAIVSGGGEPIIGLGLAAILTFPLIVHWSWKKIVATSLGVMLIVSFVLYFVMLPQGASLYYFNSDLSSFSPIPMPVSLLLTSSFATLKGVPIILLGAAVGRLVLSGKDLKKMFILIGGGISGAYMLVPTLLGTGLLHMLLVSWTYPHAMLFTVGMSLLTLGMFQAFEARNMNVNAFTVLGRSSLLVYYGHLMLMFSVLLLIGFEKITLEVLGGLMVAVTVIVWILVYFYSKRRWGNPATW
jgi:uncharacterized membrane protein